MNDADDPGSDIAPATGTLRPTARTTAELGGVYALEQLASEGRDYRSIVVEVLSAFIRGRASLAPRERARLRYSHLAARRRIDDRPGGPLVASHVPGLVPISALSVHRSSPTVLGFGYSQVF